MRGLLAVAVVLVASAAFAATSVNWADISDSSPYLDPGATVFPSLFPDDPGKLIFDNSAVLPFSTAPYASGNAWINFPLVNSDVTIHSLLKSYDTTDPQSFAHWNAGQDFVIGDMPNAYYTNTQGSDSDPAAFPYFPYNIPRPQRDCAEDFTAVYLQFARPATQFGIYLPCASNNWDHNNPIAPNDDNYQFVSGKWIDVYIMHAGDTFLTAERFELTLNGYCPFVMVNDPDGFVGVVIRDNCALNSGPTIGFMDAYATFLPQPHAGDANNDGKVDVVDLGILAKNYDTLTGATWAMADFNGDTKVDVVDLGILAKNYDWVGAPAGAAVPEPMTLSLLAVGGLALLRRKR